MASPRVRRLRRAARLSKTTPAPVAAAPVAAVPVAAAPVAADTVDEKRPKTTSRSRKAKRVSAKKSD